MKQVALVTGSSRGIGLAAAEALAKEGFSLAVNGPVDDAELRAAVARLEGLGAKVVAAPFDVSDISAHEGVLARIEDELGPLTTLVNNAGVGVLQR
ncbi:3-ketoacyl-ACP reductase, partial [Gluconobacter japonicus]